MPCIKVKGFTLVEIIIYIALLNILVLGVVSISGIIITSQISFNKKVDKAEEVIFITSILSSLIHSGLIFEPEIQSTGSELMMTINNKNVKVFLSNNQIFIQRDNNNPIELLSSNDITSNLNFSYVLNQSNDKSIRVSFNLNGEKIDIPFTGI